MQTETQVLMLSRADYPFVYNFCIKGQWEQYLQDGITKSCSHNFRGNEIAENGYAQRECLIITASGTHTHACMHSLMLSDAETHIQ